MRTSPSVAFAQRAPFYKAREKARSIGVPKTASGGRRPLPGEHGFRFYPRFYTHVIDTMKRIPLGDGKSVYDNLIDLDYLSIVSWHLKDEAVWSDGEPITAEDVIFTQETIMNPKWTITDRSGHDQVSALKHGMEA